MLAAIVLYVYNPENVSFFPQCPFYATTGLECPGCGTQRALHSLMHLRIGEALRYNAFIIFAIPYIISGVYVEYLGGKQRFPKLEKSLFGKYAGIIVFTVVILYWIIRNL